MRTLSTASCSGFFCRGAADLIFAAAGVDTPCQWQPARVYSESGATRVRTETSRLKTGASHSVQRRSGSTSEALQCGQITSSARSPSAVESLRLAGLVHNSAN